MTPRPVAANINFHVVRGPHELQTTFFIRIWLNGIIDESREQYCIKRRLSGRICFINKNVIFSLIEIFA